MKKWEYNTERKELADFVRDRDHGSSDYRLRSDLNDEGKNGWELCGVVPNGAEVVLIYKRPDEFSDG
jgi:hypothetical protein